jgi:hypothetical protein
MINLALALVITIFAATNILSILTNGTFGFFALNYAYSVEVTPDSLKEIRENLLEVRLSLQKGDLIEALQHLNNVDEQILLLTSNNTSSIEYEKNKNIPIPAQEEKISIEPVNMTNHIAENLQDLKISFDSIKINNDHDLLYEGEWKIDAYVNGKKISLLSNSSMGVESGQTVVFPKGDKFMNIQIMDNQTLRIVTLGIEYDSKTDQLKNYLPDISSILDNDNVPLSEDKDRSRFSIEPFTAFDRNDAIGIVAKEFTAKDNFGIGLNHDYCSESSGEAGDLYDIVDTNCDFQLRFSIESNNKI